MAARLKIAEIARRTGLSISTVSRVLAGKANTSVRAKQLVLDSARAEGVLDQISPGRVFFSQILVFAPARAFDVREDVFYYRMLQGIRSAVEAHETHLSYCTLEEEGCDTPQFLKRMSDPAVEAALIIGVDDPKIYELTADIGKPCVLINCRDAEMRLDAVLPDHQQIAECTANYLISQGHRDIVTMICLRRFTLERRLNGIREAYATHNMVFDESRNLITTSGFSSQEAAQALDAYLDLRKPDDYPTAIICVGDFMASGAMDTLKRRQINVPTDISLMSIDGFNLGSIGELSLSSGIVPREELGQEAIALLQRRVTRPEAPVCNLLVCGRLALGNSVRRAGNRKLRPAVSTRNHGLYGG